MAAGVAGRAIFAQEREPLRHRQSCRVVGALAQGLRRQRPDIGRFVSQRFQQQGLPLRLVQAHRLFYRPDTVLRLPRPKPLPNLLCIHEGQLPCFGSSDIFAAQAAASRSS